ncbi:MAG: alpha/beta hydrolase, partial [Gemmataceae bacterium]
DELLLFYPSKYPEGNWQPPNLAFEDAWFNAEDGTRLHGWYCLCENARAVLLYAHGNGGNLAQLSQLLTYFQNQLRVAALAFDYRGYGRSEGDPSAQGILQDARAARAFLAERARVKPSEIVLMGRSLGGAVVAQLAGDVRPRGLILESTFSSLRDEAAYHYPRLAWLVPENKLNSVAQLERYDGPLLVSHGDADRTIPYQLGLKLFEAAKGPKHFVRIPGGDHNDPQSAEYFQQLDEFIADLPK